jgi:hypothetical protein
MISIERLFELLSPRGIAIGAPVGGKGLFSQEDAMGVVAMVQGKFPIGVKVLEAKIAGDVSALNSLKQALAQQYELDNLKPLAAMALASLALNEVCGSPVCPKCKGTKQNYHRSGECLVCSGTGKLLNTVLQLSKSFSVLSGVVVTQEQFSRHFYDLYMAGIDSLYLHQADAERYAKRVLGLVKVELEHAS